MLGLKSQRNQPLCPTLLMFLQVRSKSHRTSNSHRLLQLQVVKDTTSASFSTVTTNKGVAHLHHHVQTCSWGQIPSLQARWAVAEKGCKGSFMLAAACLVQEWSYTHYPGATNSSSGWVWAATNSITGTAEECNEYCCLLIKKESRWYRQATGWYRNIFSKWHYGQMWNNS